MKTPKVFFLTFVLVVFLMATISGARAQELFVVGTEPPSGAQGVSPQVQAVTIRFNAPVKMNSWSFVISDQGEFPQTTSDPYFPTPTQCVLPVRLKPGTTYALGINSPTRGGFKLAADERVVCRPFVLSFSTAEGLHSQSPVRPPSGPVQAGPGWDPKMAGIWLNRENDSEEVLVLYPDFNFQLRYRSIDGDEYHQGTFTMNQGSITAQAEDEEEPYSFGARLKTPDILEVRVTDEEGREEVLDYVRRDRMPPLSEWSPPREEPSPAPGPRPQVDSEQVREVWPLYYVSDGQSRSGVSKKMTVTVEPNAGRGLRVGFFESEVMGSGHQWRSAGWMATVMTGFLTGQPMNQCKISFDVAGRIDGPSAGGLMTSTLISAIMNRPILPNVTMTGTINPDGTIGPVSGIYYKLQGAKDVGMVKVLVPFGSSPETQPDGNKQDLFARAGALGLELVEVEDIFQAFQHLTGSGLPQVQDTGQALLLPPNAIRAAEQALRRWEADCRSRLDVFARTTQGLPRQVRNELAQIQASAQSDYQTAMGAWSSRRIALAWAYMARATVTGEYGFRLAALLAAYQQAGLDGARRAFEDQKMTPDQLQAILKGLSAQKANNLNDLITLAECYGFFDAALGQHLLTENLLPDLDQLKGKPEEFMELLETLTGLEATARAYFNLIEDFMRMGLGHPGPPLPAQDALEEWAMVMRKAGEANLLYIDKTIVQPLAENVSKPPAAVEAVLMGQESAFQLAALTPKALPVLMDNLENPVHRAAAALGGLTASWAMSSLVVAKYYSLGVETDKSGRQIGLTEMNRLKVMLKSSEWQLRNTILRLMDQGVTPVIPLFHLQIAQGLSASPQVMNDQLWGLSEFWFGSTYGRLFLAMGSGG